MRETKIIPDALLIAARDAARRLAISERTLFTQTKAGTLPSVRIGGRVLYSVVALERWIAERTEGGNADA
jgi:excisionase family DNA binding protein